MWAHTDSTQLHRDFTWSESDEPHATRRKEILLKYPEMKTLFAKEPRTLYLVLLIFISNMTVAYFIRDYSWPVLILVAYVFGGTVNHSSQLAVHELSHNLAFDSVVANRCTQLLANLATGIPSAMTFTRYHMEHHQFQGVDGIDTDVPTMWEVNFFTTALRKLVWVILQPLFYAVRPLLVKPKSPGFWEGINYLTQFTFDGLVLYYFGFKSLAYMVIGSLLGLGLHPTAGHFIAEHYQFTKGQETYSYYGPCNWVNFNVGYHYEHHDFPKIPWSNLPKVRKIAPEYYDTLPSYNSYTAVIWKYIMDPTVGPFSRIKRRTTTGMEKYKQVQS